MEKNILLIIMALLPCMVSANSDMTKQEKAIAKALKKKYKLESVEVERPFDGLVYYNLLTKDFRRMIADSTGQVIIPQSKQSSDAYKNNIIFIRGHEKGLDRFREKGRNAKTVTAFYPGNQSAFLVYKVVDSGVNEYQFFSTSGELLNHFNGFIREDFNSPVYISKDLKGNYGLMTLDGRELIPNEYTAIETSADGICAVFQKQDGIERMGGVCFSDMTKTKVPCIFNYVGFSDSNNCWMVQVHECDSILAYNENRRYDTSFLDEGQKLFEQQKYEEVRKFYTLSGSDAKWASFYIGAAYYKTIVAMFQDMNDALEILEKSINRQDRVIASDIWSDLSLFNEESGKAERALQAYISIGHTMFAAKAKEMLYELSEMESSTSGMKRRISMAIADLDQRCAELDRMEQKEYNRLLDQQKIDLEQQRLKEQRLARELREREMRMIQRTEAERRKNKARKREEERHQAQLKQQHSQPAKHLPPNTTQQPPKTEQQKKQTEQKTSVPKSVESSNQKEKFHK